MIYYRNALFGNCLEEFILEITANIFIFYRKYALKKILLYIYIYMCVYIYIYISKHTNAYIYMYIHMLTYI